MQKYPVIHIVWGCLAFAGLLYVMNPANMTGGTRGRYMRQQAHYAEAFKAGDPNVPLLEMDWFSPTVYFCRVNQSGKGAARRDVGYAIQSGVSISLDETNLQALVEIINKLPPPPKHSLPVERQIVLGCIRSNQWFRAVYDRADIPKEIQQVSEIAGVYLPWYIPEAKGRMVARADSGGFFCVATEAPIAVSAGVDFLQVWKLDRWFNKAATKLYLTVYDCPLDSVVISSDGNIISLVSYNKVEAIDWKAGRTLLQANHPDRMGHWIQKCIAIGGNHQQFLFTAGTQKIERWDIFTGEKLAVLMTNQDVSFLKTSENGKILVAGFGGNVGIWQADKNEPLSKLEGFKGSVAGLSPDGEWIALSQFGSDNLVLFKWRTGERREVRLGNYQEVYSVYWSPDGKRLAVYDGSIIIYDAANWKPIARWDCGVIGQGSEFSFGSDGTLYQIRNNELNALDVSGLKSLDD